jgi:hypothetical protein
VWTCTMHTQQQRNRQTSQSKKTRLPSVCQTLRHQCNTGDPFVCPRVFVTATDSEQLERVMATCVGMAYGAALFCIEVCCLWPTPFVWLNTIVLHEVVTACSMQCALTLSLHLSCMLRAMMSGVCHLPIGYAWSVHAQYAMN